MLVTDLIPEEAESWTENLLQHRLDPIFLVAPTTSRQTARTNRAASARIHLRRVTCWRDRRRDEMTRDAEALVKRVRSVSDLPVAVGFGISSPEQVRAVWRFADAAVVGSAIVSEIERLSGESNLVNQIGEFAASLNKPL